MASIDDWKPKVGMEVFIVSTGERYNPRTETITKVARKYFYIQKYGTRYFIDTKAEDNGEYCSQSHCYQCEADYRRVVELRDKRREIERNIRKLTDEQVDTVYEWITTNNDKA